MQGISVFAVSQARSAQKGANVTTGPARAIDVVAAIVEQEGRLLVTRRLHGTHLAGLWEFPGGKCEPGETHEACLMREMTEELGVQTVVGIELLRTEHAYPERTVRLHFFECRIVGVPQPLLGQEIRWVARDQLRSLEFPAADAELIARLEAVSE
jgi:mutator protein MutT